MMIRGTRPHRIRTLLAWALVAPCVHAASADLITSTFTNAAGDQFWTNPGNWDHQPPISPTYPKNGNEGHTFHVVMPNTAILDTNIVIEGLEIRPLGGVIGGNTLTVNGTVRVTANGSPDLAGSGTLVADTIVVTSGFEIEGAWRIEADTVVVGSASANGLIQLRDSATLQVGSALTFVRDGDIAGPGAAAKLRLLGDVEIEKTGTAGGTSDISAYIEGTRARAVVAAGQLRFLNPVRFGSLLTNLEVFVGNGTSLSFVGQDVVEANNLHVNGGDGGEVILSDIRWDGAVITSEGVGSVRMTGSNARIESGTLNCGPTAPFLMEGGSLGGAARLENLGAFEWRNGTLTSFLNRSQPPGGARTGTFINSTRVAVGFGNAGHFTQNHTVRIAGAPASIENEGEWIIGPSASLLEHVSAGGMFTNQGIFTQQDDFQSLVDVGFQNERIVKVSDGELKFLAGRALNFNEQTGTLDGGEWFVLSNGRLTILTGGAPFQILSPDAGITLADNGEFAGLENVGLNLGNLNIRCDQNIDVTMNNNNGNFTNGDPNAPPPPEPDELGDPECVLDTGDPPTFTCNVFTNWDPFSILNGATLIAIGGVDLMGSCLQGDDGYILSPLVHNAQATLAPGIRDGDPIGRISVDGDFAQSGTATLEIDLAGTAIDRYDRLDVTGLATLDGMLTIQLAEGFLPQVNDTFAILAAGSVDGEFAAVAEPPGVTFDVLYNPGDVTLRVLSVSLCDACDANCDGAIDAFDVEPFIDVLLGGTGCSPCAGDANCDGAIDAFDVEPFIDCLVGP